MRFTPSFLPLILTALAAAAEPKQAAPGTPEISPKEAAIEHLLGERSSPEALEAAIAGARKHGVTDQAILEARFIFHVDRNEDAKIAALLPQFLERKDSFRIAESEIFATRDEWLAVIEYAKALDALGKKDKAGFKTHITEAFWLSPKQGSAFAPHIERMRLEESLAGMKVDFTETFVPVATGDPMPLSKAIGERKAILLQFWSPLSAECEALLPDFAKITEELTSKDVAVATLVMDHSPSALADTRSMIGAEPPGAWLIDDPRDPLSPRMGIRSLPTFVLLSREGRVISFGSAGEQELWAALTRINPSISQPQLDSTRGNDPGE
ncbi:MAG: TlpA family protein disulfide reductase [Verrucomicrobiaceae bacterium]|nr:MAG: TlpA family protein disulfide reductase [Verrucomicrobiaceae bacterium]